MSALAWFFLGLLFLVSLLAIPACFLLVFSQRRPTEITRAIARLFK